MLKSSLCIHENPMEKHQQLTLSGGPMRVAKVTAIIHPLLAHWKINRLFFIIAALCFSPYAKYDDILISSSARFFFFGRSRIQLSDIVMKWDEFFCVYFGKQWKISSNNSLNAHAGKPRPFDWGPLTSDDEWITTTKKVGIRKQWARLWAENFFFSLAGFLSLWTRESTLKVVTCRVESFLLSTLCRYTRHFISSDAPLDIYE